MAYTALEGGEEAGFGASHTLSLPSFHVISLYKYNFWTSSTDLIRGTEKTNLRGNRYIAGD